MSNFLTGYLPSSTDTRRVRWAKVLDYFQALPDAQSTNNLKRNDTLRGILVKVLRAVKHHYGV